MAGAKGKKKQSRLAFAPIDDARSLPAHRPDNNNQAPSSFSPARLRYSDPFSGKVTVKGQLQLEDYMRNWDRARNSPLRDDALSGPEQPSIPEVLPNQKPIAKSSQTHSRLPNSSPSPRPSLDTAHENLSSPEIEIIRPSKRRRIHTITLSDSESNQSSLPSLQSQGDSKESVPSESKMGSRNKPRTPRRSERLKAASSPMSTIPRSTSLKIDLSGIGEPEESASEELISSPTYSKRRGRSKKPKALPVDDDSEDSDVIITGRRHQKAKTNADEAETIPATNSGTDNEHSSDEDIVPFTPSRRSSKIPRVFNINGDDEEEGTPKTPSRLRSEQDELDLEEDLEDLRDTDLREKRTRGALVNSARSVRQKHLEMLRRRRAGEKATTDEEEDDDDDGQDNEREWHEDAVNAILNLAQRYESRGDNDRDSDAESVIEANEDLDTDDSSFVEEDGELGAPVAVPFEFSRHRTKQTKDCFRDIIEWMVHSKLNPAFPRHNEVYQFAFRKLDDEVVGRVESQLMSTVWNADFQNALRARPYLEVTAHPTSAQDPCNACNRSRHWASSDLKFSGKPYSDETLEPLFDSDSDSDDDSDSNSESDSDSDDENQNAAGRPPKRDRDREGHILPSEERHFLLGRKRTCKSNAVLTHTLIHWRFHLYEWVVDYLNREEELLSNPERSLERERLSAKKRTKYANKVVEKMDSNGEVQRLWTDFHQNLRVVREMQKGGAEEVYSRNEY